MLDEELHHATDDDGILCAAAVIGTRSSNSSPLGSRGAIVRASSTAMRSSSSELTINTAASSSVTRVRMS